MKEEIELKARPGQLVIIGGAEDKHGGREILKEFVRLAGGESARLVVISAASEYPTEVAPAYVESFNRLGVRDVQALDIKNRAEANRTRSVRAVEQATGVFFTGGNQVRITRLLGGTKIDCALHKGQETGLVVAGTSAGAAMMSSIMIVGGRDVTAPRVGMVELAPGMDFLPGVLIDQHFEERGRLKRLLAAVAQYPHELGIGIDENTAVVVEGHIMEVIGEGSVTIVDAGGLTYTNLNSLERNDLLVICGVKIHILTEGYRFNLQDRVPLVQSEQTEAGDTENEERQEVSVR